VGKSSAKKGAIAGGVVGGVAVLVLIAAVALGYLAAGRQELGAPLPRLLCQNKRKGIQGTPQPVGLDRSDFTVWWKPGEHSQFSAWEEDFGF